MPSLSIVVVNWNSKELLRQCLLSLKATAAQLAPQIVVVDGGSFDGCGEMLALEFPDVVFIQSQENIGFGRANNLGFEKAVGEALLLLNPDTEVLPGAIEVLLAELQRLPVAGIVGPRLLNSDRSLQTSVQALPRPFRQAFDSEFLRRLLWPMQLWAPPTDFVPRETIEIEAYSGACMMMWAETFRKVGGFSPQYFMYAEDVDLCLKVRRAGARIYHTPFARVVHHGGGSSSSQGSSFSAVMMREALHTYMLSNHGRFHAAGYRVAVAAAAIARMLPQSLGLAFGMGSARGPCRAAVTISWAILLWSLGKQQWTRQPIESLDTGVHT
jgi:GT2 family glycosyltransferase